MRNIVLALIAATSLIAAPVTTSAAPCKDAKGKFTKCPPAKHVVAMKKAPCRDAKGKFAKCTK